MLQIDPDILESLVIPQGLNEDILKDNLVLECAELEVLYSDAEFLKIAIGIWSAKQLKYWTRIYNAERAQYNPIENYDRMEQWSDNATGNRVSSATSSSNGTTQNSNTTLDKVAGYNSEQLTNRAQSDNGGITQDYNSSTGSGTEDTTTAATHSGRVHGNIGVTTSQQMLEQELSIAPKLNTYQVIIQDFKQRFCLLIY